jgi:hypothetical protein
MESPALGLLPRTFLVLAASCFTAWCAVSHAQTAPATKSPEPTAPTATAPVVELSPFEVRSEGDSGYQAANTTSGSRLNSRLKDTPAAVSAFTPEFLADIAATNLEEMLAHATNIEIDVEDANAGFNNPQGRGADGNDYQFRMRGSPAGASRDFVESSVPVDLYNVERAEVASGPNSILFGLGQAGGLVSLSGKKANLPHAHHAESDARFVELRALRGRPQPGHRAAEALPTPARALPEQPGLAVLGLQRPGPLDHRRRVSAASSTRRSTPPTKRGTWTTTSPSVGTARTRSPPGRTAANRSSTAPPPAGRHGRFNANNNRFTFNQQDGVVTNYRGEFQTQNRYGAETLLPPSVSPYDYNLTGPGGVRHQTFNTRQLIVQQRLPQGLRLELAYFRNRTDVEANGMAVAGANLRADPNLTLPRPDGAAGTVPNPYAGRSTSSPSGSRTGSSPTTKSTASAPPGMSAAPTAGSAATASPGSPRIPCRTASAAGATRSSSTRRNVPITNAGQRRGRAEQAHPPQLHRRGRLHHLLRQRSQPPGRSLSSGTAAPTPPPTPPAPGRTPRR